MYNDGGVSAIEREIMVSISEQLKKAIRAYGTVYAVARDSGVSCPVLQRFVAGQRDVYLATADRLCVFFGMHLTQPTAKRPKANGRKTPKRSGPKRAAKKSEKGKRK